MSTITKQWLQKTIAELEEDRDATPGAVNEDAANALAAMKLALASLEADGTLANEGNITATQFKPVADLYEVTVPSGRSTTFTKDAAEASDCRVMGWHVQEYVKLERYQAAMLQGAEPVTTAYKLRDAVEIIRNSGIEIDAEKIFAERDTLNTPDCWCRTCRPVTVTDMRFVVCPDCGNKRCPHANDHRNACTGSNEPGQEGSAYPAAPQQEVK
ncbi:hypothetical protein [Enterobacter hormaechei]|uniref:hypothetical protein n=1 Tax=Enterobacter hormaechei TaxID=158836 RepID=UPI00359DBCD8